MFSLFFLILFLAGTLVCLVIQRTTDDDDTKTVCRIIKWICLGAFVITFIISSIFLVDEGEGVLLLQFGKIYETEVSAGPHVCRPWASCNTWQIRLKSTDIALDARTKDEMQCSIQATYWWAVDPSKLEDIYRNVAKNYDILEQGFVANGIFSAVRDMIAKVTFDTLNLTRDTYGDKITKYVASTLSKKHIRIDRIVIKSIKPPNRVNLAIEEKLEMKQKKEAMAHKLDLHRKKAEVRIVDAGGIATAQTIIQRKLTPIYVQYEAIQMMKELAESNNTVFVFAPTSMTGIGLPAVYQAPIK